jgi:hypothetical protein
MSKKGPLTQTDWAAIRARHAAMTPEEARAWIRKVMGPPKRTLEGKERKHILFMLALIEPFEESNNQHSWTSCYKIGNKEYHVTSFPNAQDVVDELLPEDTE